MGESDVALPTASAGSGVLVGTCAFSFDAWQGVVYPRGLPKTRRLSRFAQLFSLVELDGTYYATPAPKDVVHWAEQTPETFTFTAKVPKQVTQDPDLAGPVATQELSRFLETMKVLGRRLGPIVFQMSPGFRYPQGFRPLAQLLAKLPSLGGEGLRFAVEFRHPSWLQRREPQALLKEHAVAWVWNDWYRNGVVSGQMPRAIDEPAAHIVTADDFAYVRLTGNHAECFDGKTFKPERYGDLARWARLVQEFQREREGRTAYILVSDDYAGSAPISVRKIEQLLGIPGLPFDTPPPDSPEGFPSSPQPRLPGL